jgi:hypothetical protein
MKRAFAIDEDNVRFGQALPMMLDSPVITKPYGVPKI